MAGKRIGIFSGTFDPVHRGHVESCLVAYGVLTLDKVLIFLEKKPRRKSGLADVRDRENMLELAITDRPGIEVVDLGVDNITTEATLEYLNKNYPGGNYWYIVGSDMLKHIEGWPDYEKLLERMNLCVVLRDNDELKAVKAHIEKLQKTYPDTEFVILPSVWSPVSSSMVKEALKKGEFITSLDPGVYEYIKRHRIYD